MRIIHLERCDSTNSWASAHARELEDMTLVLAHAQEAGRGQRGNSWESAPGMNFTGTLFVNSSAARRELGSSRSMLGSRCENGSAARRELGSSRSILEGPMDSGLSLNEDGLSLPVRQFRVSMAAALAVVDALEAYGLKAMVKWSNDVYVGDRKICGILIEHAILGSDIEHSRIGIGVNVNQTEFLSDAPNPTSIALELGHPVDLSDFTARLHESLRIRLSFLENSLMEEYEGKVWRKDGCYHDFRMRDETKRGFKARIVKVEPVIQLFLAEEDGSRKSFYFKEVEFVLH